ncbi:metallophosphoesterase family protein [Rhizobium paknamense]|uniref:Serine/threonine protein phosphatase 1 n=1 Tax=Rhizobium paknamense TaxID=1206817 RepID=A0ABU0IIS7_9HYPH|nr:metallophosphoesterase family protein [Rhizobium paknamense]MDQ0457104.1 serine/threonine protein phosphatase 1 [Rhizobium paknamense]
MIKLLRKFLDTGSESTLVGMRNRVVIEPGRFSAMYAVGDVHGCFAELLDAECRILRDAAGRDGRKLIVMLGDYIDRGPSSRRVVDHLMKPLGPDFDRVTLCGNHDDVFCHFLEDPSGARRWLDFGAAATLYSYGIDLDQALQEGGLAALTHQIGKAVPVEHYDWFKSLPSLLTIGQFVFVHAGLKPGQALESQTDEDLMWIREPFLNRGPELPFTVVHGHTPSDSVTFGKNRIGIDTAAYATGRLSVLRIVDGVPSLI